MVCWKHLSKSPSLPSLKERAAIIPVEKRARYKVRNGHWMTLSTAKYLKEISNKIHKNKNFNQTQIKEHAMKKMNE